MSTIKTKEIKISAGNLALIRDCLDGRKRLPIDRTITYTAQFDDGYEMDVKCCGGGEECAWTEAVLFKDGSQVCFTEPSDDILGPWELYADGITYIAEVSVEQDKTNSVGDDGSNQWFVRSIFRKMLQALPLEPIGHFWTHERKIMCDTAARAAIIAEFLNALCSKPVAFAEYFDPEEDRTDGLEDILTGWHYVWMLA